jgi:neuronal growth regulator 1
VNKEDRGTYYCFADNGVGKGDRRNINLEIEFPPTIVTPRERIGQALNYDVDLECHIEAYPPPQIFWTKDSYIISNNRNFKISNFEPSDEFTDSTLRIVNVREKQYGEYVCQAANKLGKAEGKIFLYETKNPVCPPACGGHQSSIAVKCNTDSVVLLIVIFQIIILTFS